MTFTLTRLLYSADEVEASLINSILMKKNIDECYFWCAELYYSDREDERNIFDLIWKIFFDFYAALNPRLERYIQKKELNWRKEKNIKILIYIIHNLFYCNSTADVFLLRQYVNIKDDHDNLIIYKTRHRRYRWVKDFPASYRTMLMAIHKKHLFNAVVQLRKLVDTRDANEIYNIIIRYYSRHIELQPQNIIEQRWKKKHWRDVFHGLLSLVVHMEMSEDIIVKRLVVKQPSQDTIKMIENHNKTIEDRHRDCNKVYRILNDMRMYAIHDLSGVFYLDRYNVVDFKEKNRMNWGNYAVNCPLWKHRITEFNTLVKKKLIDLNKAEDRDFSDHYDLELDEQPENIQLMSINNIEKITINDWHDKIFNIQPIITLDFSCSSRY